MSEIKSVFFDVDGTLTYSKKPNYMVFWDVIVAEGFSDVEQETVKKAFEKTKKIYLEEGHKWKDDPGRIYRDLNKIQLAHCSIEPSEKLVDSIQDAYKDARNQALYDDVLPTLEKLKQKKLAVGSLTGGLTVDIEHRLQLLGIKDFFEHIIATGTMDFNKPDPRAFQYILEPTGFAPDEVLYVGNDYKMDIVGAENAGMKAILIDRKGKYTDLKCNRIANLGGVLEFLG